MRTEIWKNKWFWIIIVLALLAGFAWYVYSKGITIGGLTIGGK